MILGMILSLILFKTFCIIYDIMQNILHDIMHNIMQDIMHAIMHDTRYGIVHDIIQNTVRYS